MINLIDGKPRQGKSYLLANIAWDELKRKEPRHIYPYAFLGFKADKFCEYLGDAVRQYIHPWRTMTELLQIRNGIILMDEGQMFFNSRKWDQLPDELQWKMQQHGHQGLDVYISTQHIRRIDVSVRELVSEWLTIRKFFGNREGAKRIWGLYGIWQNNTNHISKPDEGVESSLTEIHWFNQKIADCYDTHIDIASEKQRKLAIYYEPCPTCNHMNQIGKEYITA